VKDAIHRACKVDFPWVSLADLTCSRRELFLSLLGNPWLTLELFESVTDAIRAAEERLQESDDHIVEVRDAT
jgi:hypothetical protein